MHGVAGHSFKSTRSQPKFTSLHAGLQCVAALTTQVHVVFVVYLSTYIQAAPHTIQQCASNSFNRSQLTKYQSEWVHHASSQTITGRCNIYQYISITSLFSTQAYTSPRDLTIFQQQIYSLDSTQAYTTIFQQSLLHAGLYISTQSH